MPGGVDLARAATRGDDAGWWGAGRLWARHSGLRTGRAVGRAGEARKGLRDPRALAGWWYALGWPRDACGVTTGPGSMQHAAQPEQTQQHQLVEKEVGYHRVAPFHGGEMGALYPFCRLLNYPHDRGTRPHWAAVYLPTADKYPRLTRLPLTGAKRHSLEGSHGLSAAHSPLVTPSMQAMRTHVACSGHLPWPLPITLLAHTPAGCGHGGTRKSKTSRKLQTWSVNPAAMAGVCDRHCLAEPLPLVGRGCSNGTRRLA